MLKGTFVVFALLALLPGLPASAEEQPASAEQKPTASSSAAEELQKAVQNPVASLISVPIQNNTNFNIGSFDRTQDVLNIQPVIPANISKNWMVISRIIQPIVWQPYAGQNTGGEYGLGDMVPTFFLSPRKPGKLIWGAGPAFTIPTATVRILGQGKLSLGLNTWISLLRVVVYRWDGVSATLAPGPHLSARRFENRRRASGAWIPRNRWVDLYCLSHGWEPCGKRWARFAEARAVRAGGADPPRGRRGSTHP